MDVGRSFTYITDDDEWITKVLIGSLISLIPFVGQFYLLGYALEVLRNVIAGREVPLPRPTEDLGGKLLGGLVMTVIGLFYFLPLIAVNAGSGLGGLLNASAESEQLRTLLAAWTGCAGCLSFVLGICGALLLPFAWCRYAESGQLADAFRLSDTFALLRGSLGPSVIVLLVSSLAGLIAVVAGVIACGVGLVITTFYAQLVAVYLYGSLYRQVQPDSP